MAKTIKVQVVDMEKDMQDQTEAQILQAFDDFSKEEKIAEEIKKFMDGKFAPSWNVIVGKNFGSHVVTMTKSYLFASLHNDEISVLIWKS